MALVFDFKRLIIRSSFVNFSQFLILLNLAISFNSSIGFLCSFLGWFNYFFEIFAILAIFSTPICDNFLHLCLLSYLLKVFTNSWVDIFWGFIMPLFEKNCVKYSFVFMRIFFKFARKFFYIFARNFFHEKLAQTAALYLQENFLYLPEFVFIIPRSFCGF